MAPNQLLERNMVPVKIGRNPDDSGSEVDITGCSDTNPANRFFGHGIEQDLGLFNDPVNDPAGVSFGRRGNLYASQKPSVAVHQPELDTGSSQIDSECEGFTHAQPLRGFQKPSVYFSLAYPPTLRNR